jgi:sugar phosphate isomerase/epimerase
VVPDGITAAVKRETEARGISIVALSGTYNMIHPDRERRAADFNRFRAIAASAHAMGTEILTLCTGTRNLESMWTRHPDNDLPDAWDNLVESMRQVLDVAEEFDLRVAFEPEPGNVINSSSKARRLLDTFANDRLGVVIDAVNTMDTAPERDPVEVLVEAFYLLGNHIFVAHAKEHDHSGREAPSGTGIVPWREYIELLRASGFSGPLIMHGLQASEVAASQAFLYKLVGEPLG